jgi:hypothetical protein
MAEKKGAAKIIVGAEEVRGRSRPESSKNGMSVQEGPEASAPMKDVELGPHTMQTESPSSASVSRKDLAWPEARRAPREQ